MLREILLVGCMLCAAAYAQDREEADRFVAAPSSYCEVVDVPTVEEVKERGWITEVKSGKGWWVGLNPALFRCRPGNDWDACRCDGICKKLGFAYGHCACLEADKEGYSHCHCTSGCCHKT